MARKDLISLAAATIGLGLSLCLMAVSLYFPGRQLFSLMILTQTGRITEFPKKSIPQIQITLQSPHSRTEGDAVLSFSPEELDAVEVYNYTAFQPDWQELFDAPLSLALSGDAPTVLILHTHTTESYTGDFSYSDPYRTLDETANMIAIGAEVARVLELGGISVIHDRNIYDYPDYNGAYDASRAAIRAHLEKNPSIQLVLDLHRDAGAGDGGSLVTRGTVCGQPSAQLMAVVGTSGSGLNHANWESNLALALKLHAMLERADPGITRPIALRRQRFNGDLSPNNLLIEVGAAGNTLEEAILAANALARAILMLNE